MSQRLIRVFLALAVAFVFTGRMEAAAQHCAQLIVASEAAEPVVVASEEAAPCHGMDKGMDEVQPAKTHHPAPHTPLPGKCECVAVLKACTPVIEATASSRIEPYAWVRPATVVFASVEPAPALRPPRA
jgi:hypothetical protein